MLKNIVLDCDGVILDWHLGFYDWMRAQGHTVTHPYPTDYAMTQAHPGKSKDEIWANIPIFNRSPDFGRLAPCDGAEDGIRSLKARFPATPITVLTSVGDAPETRLMRRESLAHLPIDELILVPLGVSKRSWLEKFTGPALLVEDHPGHATDAAELGFTSILIDRPWNRDLDDPQIERARSWAEIVAIAARRFPGNRAA